MILTMNDTIKLLQSYKGKTVEEVIDILQKKKQEVNNMQSLLQEKRMGWYKSCIGKYYKIQHNNTAFSLVHIKEEKKPKNIDQYQYQNNPIYFLTWDCYGVVLSDKPRIESNAGFNLLWLCNPYEEGTMSSLCNEITKEEFDGITSPFDSLIDKAKQILK